MILVKHCTRDAGSVTQSCKYIAVWQRFFCFGLFVMFVKPCFTLVCLSIIAGDGNCTVMGGRFSRDCIFDTNNAFEIEVCLLYFISPILIFQDQGLCMCTRLPGPTVVTVVVRVHICLFVNSTSVRSHVDFFVKLTYVCSTQIH